MLSNYTNLYFPVCSLAISILLFILFFTKDKVNNDETKIYSKLVAVGLLESSLFVFNSLVAHFWFSEETYFLFSILNKTLYSIYIIWFSLLFYYMFSLVLSNNKKSKLMPLCKASIQIIDIIVIIIMFALKIDIYYDAATSLANSYGPAANALYLGISFYIFLMVLIAIQSIKKANHKKFIPLYILIVLMVITMIIRLLDPYLVIYSNVLSFTLLVMYFTIENPDVKMLEELYKNRKIIERTNENTSNFLFKISQDIKNPVKQIIDITNKKESLKEINNLGKNLEYLIEDVLDVSKMTTKNLKLYNTRYNPTNLFYEVKYKIENELDNNVKLECNLSTNIPQFVYGDSIKLKQILLSTLENSKQHTQKGFIEIDVNTIIKYGVCRFIINITDSGEGISIDRVNEILSLSASEEKIDFDKTILTLKEVKALVQKIDGSLTIKSTEGKGTTIGITIDQKIVETKEVELTKKLEMYEESLYKNKKIMVVDDDAKELSEITSYLEKNAAIVSSSLFGNDVVDKISNKHNFDLIILDDETSTNSALTILKELQKNGSFNIPVVVMINDNKEFIKLNYLKDGFADCIMKSKLKSELERIIKRFY